MTDAPDCGLNRGEHVLCRGYSECQVWRRTACVVCGARIICVTEELDHKAICSLNCWEKRTRGK